MKCSKILQLIIGAQILGLMTLPCAFSMQRKTSINDLVRDPVQLMLSFLPEEQDRRNFAQTSKKFNRFYADARWRIIKKENKPITFDVSKKEGINNWELALNQLRRLNLPIDKKEDNTQETKKEQGVEHKDKKIKIVGGFRGTTEKKPNRTTHLKLKGVNESNSNEIYDLLDEYKDYIEDVSVRLQPTNSEFIFNFIKATTIPSIDLSADKSINMNGMRDEMVESIAEALMGNTIITSINMGFNYLSLNGVNYIAQTLNNNKTITSIDLRGSIYGGNSVGIIANMLETNTTITSINLSFNYFTSENVQIIARALKKNTTIKSIDLRGNQISEQIKEHLKILAQQKKIEILL